MTGVSLSVKGGARTRSGDTRRNQRFSCPPWPSLTVQGGNVIVMFSGKILMFFLGLVLDSWQFLNNM